MSGPQMNGEMGAVRFEVVRAYDPAICFTNSVAALHEFCQVRDLSRLTLDEAVKPIVFRCSALSRDQRNHVRDQGTEYRQVAMAFRYGLIEIKNIGLEDGTVKDWTPRRHAPKDALTPDMLDAIEAFGFGDNDVADIGSVIVARSFLARGVPLRCQLLDTSQRAITLMLLRRAEQAPAPTTPVADSLP